jgi:alpha-glucoside transport system permease protein
MNPLAKLNNFFKRLPLHLAIIIMVLLWLIPTLGLFITSFRTREDVRNTGWWTAFAAVKPVGQVEYNTYCASCHGADGKKIPTADLSDPNVTSQYTRSINLLVDLKKPVNGGPHLVNPLLPDNATQAQAILSPILTYIHSLSAGGTPAKAKFTISNYVDALVGYKGTADYLTDCQNKVPSTLAVFKCNTSDLLNQAGMGRAFLNTLAVAIPSTIIPIIFAALAAYGFAWLDFRGRQWLFALLVGLQIIPLQMTLVPIARLYARIGLQGSFLGIWLFHTGFGLPFAIYLLWNFIKSLPKEIFESVYLDGANHWTAFRRLALPLSIPAIASLAIFQFLWIWNDFLVAKVFLSSKPVLTVQITNLIDPLGGNWNILTGAAFLSFIVPMAVFFGFQKYFARGLLSGSVKG